jgi:hypothetical protein
MKLNAVGKRTSKVEVTAVTRFGLWILVHGNEYFLPFDQYPWFKNASLGKVFNVHLQGVSHLYWPELDVDLMVDGLRDITKYPLVFSAIPA